MAAARLEVVDLSCRYDKLFANKHVNLTVERPVPFMVYLGRTALGNRLCLKLFTELYYQAVVRFELTAVRLR